MTEYISSYRSINNAKPMKASELLLVLIITGNWRRDPIGFAKNYTRGVKI